MFLSSDMGKRVLNFCYSWGASIVILGAMFKILHLPYANQILFFAMIVESLVFAVSAFEKPSHDYNWEDVFPVLKSKNPLDRPEFGKNGISGMTSEPVPPTMQGGAISGGVPSGLANLTGSLDVSQEDTQTLADSIKKLNGAAEQISKMADLTDATQKYLSQLSEMSENMSRFCEMTGSISDVSTGINQHSQDYVQQMESLNRNINGLNSLYETQLRGITSQMESIDHINAGLYRIRDMYDHSVVDSSVFRAETEKMAQQLTQLNQVYSRLLQAMTVNMYGQAGAPYPPQQQGYAPQQPQANPYQGPYTQNPGQGR